METKWISVDERLPEMGKKGYCSDPVLVAVKCNNGLQLVEVGDLDFYGYWNDYGNDFGKHVTHWMPLPNPPKTENK